MAQIYYTVNGLKLDMDIDNIETFENTNPKTSNKKTTPKTVKKNTPKTVKKNTPKTVKKNTPKSVKKVSPKSVKKVSTKSVKKVSSKSVKKNTPKLSVKSAMPKKKSVKTPPNILANNLNVNKQLCVGKSCLNQTKLGDLMVPKVILYSACDYKGTAVSVGIGGFDISKLNLTSNKINSLRIPRGMQIKLFESIGLTGRQVTIDFDVPCFDSLIIESFHWKNKVNSIEIQRNNTNQSSLQTMMGNNIKFTNAYTNYGKDSEYKAEIANDYDKHKQLLIVGNKSKGDGSRNVGILDNLTVGNRICIKDNCVDEHSINPNKLHDTRFERLTPDEYKKKGVGEYKEFKVDYIKKDKSFQNVITMVPIDGKIKQIIYSDDGMYYRTGINNEWSIFNKVA
jgi:hypothetical protein